MAKWWETWALLTVVVLIVANELNLSAFAHRILCSGTEATSDVGVPAIPCAGATRIP
jgi:hypothetical protein